jgi:N-carbamoyl-L-amino-acid hydrolase
VDLRNTDSTALVQAESDLHAYVQQAAKAEGVRIISRALARFEPVAFDPMVVNLVEHQTQALGCTYQRMPSGAGHDAQMLARVCPSAMIFVPSVGGLSHNVREHTERVDLQRGAQLLLQVVLALANRPT